MPTRRLLLEIGRIPCGNTRASSPSLWTGSERRIRPSWRRSWNAAAPVRRSRPPIATVFARSRSSQRECSPFSLSGRRHRYSPDAYQTPAPRDRTYPMRKYPGVLPEFVDRFGTAYKAELEAFVECCRTGAPFPTTHRDGLRAQQVISAGMQSVFTERQATPV